MYLWWQLESVPVVVHIWDDHCVQVIILLSIEDGQVVQSQVHNVNPLHF